MKQADLMDIFKKASNSVCTCTIVVSPYPWSPTPSTSSAIKTPENTEDPDDPEPADGGDTQTEYLVAQPKHITAVEKNCPQGLQSL
jgi:hypothetical protein